MTDKPDILTQHIHLWRDWLYDHYYWAYLSGTAVICNSMFFPDAKATLLSWLACGAAGAVLEPCVNPYRQFYGKSLGRLSGDQPRVALTFDDGPGEDTPELLDLLKREKVQASFFLIGTQIEKHPDLVRRIADEGHLIGNHTYSHPNLMLCSPQRTHQELARVQGQVEQLTGQKPTFWRPPFGFRAPWTQAAASKLGLRSALWTTNPRDFQDPGAQVIVDRTMAELQKGLIVLLHDGLRQRAQTLEATRALIALIKDKKYQLVRLDSADA